MTLGVGQNSLGKARFFLVRFRVVESAEPFDVFGASAYLEAAIVFGKATIDSVLSHVAPGDAKSQEAWLKSSPLWNPFCTFFADARGFIVHHDKTVDVTPRTTVTVRVPTARAYVTGMPAIATVTPPDPTPWQRVQLRKQRRADEYRAAKIKHKQEERVRRLIEQDRLRAELWALENPVLHETRVHFTHTDHAIAGPTAADVVQSYIDRIADVVAALP